MEAAKESIEINNKTITQSSQKASRVDDILTGIATGNNELKAGNPEVYKQTQEQKPEAELVTKEKLPPANDIPVDNEKPLAADTIKEPTVNNIDEYGNEVVAPRTYTDEDVNRIVRERLARAKVDKPVAAPVTPIVAIEQNPENWEQQLETVLEDTITKREQRIRTEAMQKQEQEVQSRFEQNFTTGMTKYQDFQNVTRDKPITDAIMIGTRSMSDPAGFLYAACKNHPEEVRRIALLTDPAAQIAEVGRLDERMKKSKAITNASRPLGRVSGDVVEATETVKKEKSIEDRIAEHAKSKSRR